MFILERPHFRSVRIVWQGLTLNDGPQQPMVDLSDQDINELLINLWGPLGLIELVELHQQSHKEPALSSGLNWSQLISKSGFQYNERLWELIQKLSFLPSSFLKWAQEKKCSPQDLMPINALSQSHPHTAWLDLAHLNPTRSEGKQLVDLVVDLLLFGCPVPTPDQGLSAWVKELRQLRYPEQHRADQDKSAPVQNWPQFAQVRKVRQGDRLLHSLQLLFSDHRDLQDKLKRLQQLPSQEDRP
jgi:hypothetical protein